MIPLYIGGCFGMLHPATGRHAALICGPLGDEALNAHRSLVLLAEHLAAAGIPALRLNYYGAGDSAGIDHEAGRFQHWIDGIRGGMDWLHAACGAEAVTLIGHRIGAGLAARAACDCARVESLVLLSPVSGRQFLHELTLGARISQRVWQTSHKADDGAWFEAAGLRIDRATRDALNTLDLRQLPARPAARALVLDAEQRPATTPLLEGLRRRGMEVAFEPHAGLERMLRDSFEAHIPDSAMNAVARWMQPAPGGKAATRDPATDAAASLSVGQAHETPIRFGPDESLFGILTMPEHPSPKAPAILMVNTSANPRWGNARIAVDLARSLADDGLPSLRMDAGGMGDSAPTTGEVGRPYSQSVTEDTLHAAVELERQTGRPVVVFGFCSGAWHALQEAFHDPAIHGLILVNLPRFLWRDGDAPDEQRRLDLRPTAFYVRNLLSAQAWSRLLRGDFDVVNLARVLALRIARRALAGLDPLLGAATRVGRVRLAVQDLARRGVPILYVLGRNDPGVEELAAYFGSDGWRLRRQPNVTMHTLENADHTLSAEPVRAALIRHIREWCRVNWSPAEAAPDRVSRRAKPLRIDARTPLGVLFRRPSVPGR